MGHVVEPGQHWKLKHSNGFAFFLVSFQNVSKNQLSNCVPARLEMSSWGQASWYVVLLSADFDQRHPCREKDYTGDYYLFFVHPVLKEEQVFPKNEGWSPDNKDLVKDYTRCPAAEHWPSSVVVCLVVNPCFSSTTKSCLQESAWTPGWISKWMGPIYVLQVHNTAEAVPPHAPLQHQRVCLTTCN